MMTTMPLTEFLLARIAEDEEIARAAIADDGGQDGGFEDSYAELIRPGSGVGIARGGFGEAAARVIATYAVPRRVLAECEAKRDIITHVTAGYEPDQEGWDSRRILKNLARRYADHPDYREEWKP